MEIYDLIIPGGILAYSLILITVLSGLRIIKLKYTAHKYLGISALSIGTIHAALVLYSNYFG